MRFLDEPAHRVEDVLPHGAGALVRSVICEHDNIFAPVTVLVWTYTSYVATVCTTEEGGTHR